VQNPKPLERLWAAVQQRMVRALQRA
jgi:hypothetical protein